MKTTIHPSAAHLYAAAALAGAASLALEIIAGRLLAPFYGQSVVVWAGVIGAVLLNMALGSVVGGRLADRFGPRRRIYSLLPLGAALASTILTIPCYYSLKYVFAAAAPGYGPFVLILFLALELFSLPVLFIAALLPVIACALSVRGENAGSVLGRVLAANTMGSIAGAAMAALILIPLAGVVWSIMIVNLLLLLTAIPFMCGGEKPAGGTYIVLFILMAAVIFSSALLWRHLDIRLREPGVVASFDTAYNYVRIYDGPGGPALAVNDPYFIQSIAADGPVRVDAWHLYLLGPALAKTKGPGRALFLGYGAGSAAALYRRYFPDLELTGVEIDPGMVAAGKKYLGDGSGAAVIIGDARSELYRMDGPFDVIVADVFRFPYMPHHTMTVEFFRLVKRKLGHGGVFIFNAGRYDDDDAVARSVARSLSIVFGSVRLLPLGRFNTLIFASDRGKNQDASTFREKELTPLSDYFTANVRTYEIKSGDTPFRDDLPSSEFLTNIMGMRFLGSEEYR